MNVAALMRRLEKIDREEGIAERQVVVIVTAVAPGMEREEIKLASYREAEIVREESESLDEFQRRARLMVSDEPGSHIVKLWRKPQEVQTFDFR